MDSTPPSVACGITARSPTIGDLAARLAAVYGKLRNLEEGGTNAHQRWTFVALGQVTDPVRAAMAEAGVIVMPSIVDFAEAEWPMRNGVGVKVTVTAEFTWIAAESGEWFTTRWTAHGFDAGDKAFSKAHSTLLKAALMKTFLISSASTSDEDPDAESPEQHTPRWSRFELTTEIETLVAAAGVGDEVAERFQSYLLDVYRVNTWTDMPTARLIAIRDRLRSLTVEERRQTILDKIRVADAA